MALLPQNPRSQKLLLLAIASLALGGAYWQLLWTPQHTELVALEADEGKAWADLEMLTGRELIDARSVAGAVTTTAKGGVK